MDRPRIKPEHAPYRTTRGAVRLGSGLYGLATEVEDPDGRWWTLISALDGSRTAEQVADRVCRAYPDMSPTDVTAALEELATAGHIDDAAAPPPTDFTPRELERYDRGVRLYRWTDPHPRSSPWDVQRLLRSARVLVVGLGGTGGAAARSLAVSGVGHLHCVDADTVELSNLNRQTLYTEDDLGKPKAAAAVQRLRHLNADITISGETRRIDTIDDFIQALSGHTFLVLCADQPDDVRARANRACLATGIPWVDAGYHGALITSAAYVPGEGPCWMCLRIAENKRLKLPVTSDEDVVKAVPKARGHPVNAVTAGLSGELAAHLTIALLTRAFPIAPGTLYGLNLAALNETVALQHPRQDECDACADLR
jgi:molybdopterin/thiamine biosynthesis adenylyltransferase